MSKPVKNVAASARQKLANLAKESKRPFAELLQYYAMERFLYRLSRSEYKDRLVLKGALMFVAWGTPRSRATKDIDLWARTDNSVENLVALIQDICRVDGIEDTGHENRTTRGIPNQIQRCLELIRLFNVSKHQPNACVEGNGDHAP